MKKNYVSITAKTKPEKRKKPMLTKEEKEARICALAEKLNIKLEED